MTALPPAGSPAKILVQLDEAALARWVQWLVEALERGRIDVALLHPPVSVDAPVHELKLGAEAMIAALPARNVAASAA